jgi:hypothetical protein
MGTRMVRVNRGWISWPHLPWTGDLDEVIRMPEVHMETLAAGRQPRRDRGGQRWISHGDAGDHAAARAAGDTVDPRSLNGLSQGHGWQVESRRTSIALPLR